MCFLLLKYSLFCENLIQFFLDEDECKRINNDCNDVNKKALKVGVASCKNTVGSYDCVCASGFTYNETTRACTGKTCILYTFDNTL